MLKCLYAKLESEPMNYYQSLNSNINIHINLTQKTPIQRIRYTESAVLLSPTSYIHDKHQGCFYQPTRKQAFRVIVCCEM